MKDHLQITVNLLDLLPLGTLLLMAVVVVSIRLISWIRRKFRRQKGAL